LSTGGTAKLLADKGLPVTEVAEVTGSFPRCWTAASRPCTPRCTAACWRAASCPSTWRRLKAHGIDTIDLLVVNLYPFEATVAKAGCTLADAIENIDIGGPAMVRSAAKNWKDVGVITGLDQYAACWPSSRRAASCPTSCAFALSVAAFNRISQYDGAISDYLSSVTGRQALRAYVPARTLFPGQSNGIFTKVQDLRYGENSHQQAALYRDLYPAPGSLVTGVQLQGKELSYNNIADADAAWECVKSFDAAACVIVKHANPCGVAVGLDALEAYSKAFQTDPTSPSAASSPSTARWTARPRSRSASSSSRC
jgi:phosphoribosylaminoimidazolecarboxamide formyltransferase/IMP cyclohydrolase